MSSIREPWTADETGNSGQEPALRALRIRTAAERVDAQLREHMAANAIPGRWPRRLATSLRLAERLGTEPATLEAERDVADAILAYAAERPFPVASLSVIFMTSVVVVHSRRGLGPALAAAVLGFFAHDFFFTEPRFALGVSRQGEVLTLGLFHAASRCSPATSRPACAPESLPRPPLPTAPTGRSTSAARWPRPPRRMT
ncbi:DUF4118 domain-containing protein [Rhodobacter sp. Har01]|uniref:DUF4118 domain-containing protein n=1 Tax=Rhodobacter sp. Har01 TaxID=2883999 RepID=UPI001D07BEBB|nr:DUF4118 domain-containing protein [Rhodobacter sp. Har01]MCB6178580.1 DUF4118 domain-containing protein [Rhodobacter sp. Har01]